MNPKDEEVSTGDADEEKEIEDMKRRVQEMEEEAEKLKELQESVAKEINSNTAPASAAAVGGSVEDTSIYVGQVDYEAKPDELQAHFASCGTINRVTILCNPFTGKPRGYAYVEFADVEAVENALLLNDSIFKGRELKVAVKRVNFPGMRGGKGKGKGKGKG
eukprot:CAMPEP_0185743680 /NCGR_PEP_ID=MMETSP1174-20130828/1488_1 /TAXON_ID=35687 /ORGANISM="Dictyocha speculum, Strain CCMP1381" /LENGTH=161 /DNA_ID=CAMNT_0028416541 /DNA_START=37 /DNA_END=519 /DNA_ORIENTATION=-